MSIVEFLPDFMLTERQRIEREFDGEQQEAALEGLRSRLGELLDAERVFAQADEFMQQKANELQRIQDAILFSKGDETLRLQGRGLALFEFVRTPRIIHEERLRVERQIAQIQTAGPDAGESGER